MNGGLASVWVYLAASPLLWLTVTLLAYQSALWIYRRCNQSPLANPVALAVAGIVTLLLLTGVNYQTYFAGAQFVHFLLGPATVALAVPLYAQWRRLQRMVRVTLIALICGSLTAIFSAVGIARSLGASEASQWSLAPKSVTTPIAMGIAEKIGGLPSLTAVLVVTTGILGAILAPLAFRLVRANSEPARGFALGLAAHGIGTARAFQISETTGAFAALAMGLNGLLTALLLPIFVVS